MQQVEGRTAFVTGGASGIGLGIAGVFLRAGMRVMIADLRPDHIATARTALQSWCQSGQLRSVTLDVTDRAAMAAAAAETERVFGKVHVLVNNAGVGIQGPFKGITFADWDFGMSVNLGGVINGIQTFLPLLRRHGEGGHIVSTASLAALTPMSAQFVIYVAAKAAVVSLSETIRGELGQENIGVSVLCPGPVRTNIGDVKHNRPPQFGVGEAFRAAEEAGATHVPFPSMMEPAEVGELVLNAVRNNELYVITHGEWRAMAEAHYSAILSAMPTRLDPKLVAMLQGRS